MDTLALTPRLPPLLRALDALGGGLRHLGLGVGRYDPDALIASATRRAGLTDFGPDDGWREALQVYCASLERDVALRFFGWLHVRDMLARSLVDRLHLQAARPRLGPLSQPPLVVCGLPRSGTTFLHRLLCEADATRALPLWELMEPIRPPGPDRRLARAQRRMARIKAFTPSNLDAIHLMRPELPDECSFLFKSAFRSAMLWQVPATSWLDWHLAAPATEAYRDWRDWLRLLQAPGRRYVLKDPFHVGNLPALFAAVPDAMVVRTHRDPLETLPSYHKLTLNSHAVLCARLDVPAIVEANTRWQLALTDAIVRPQAGVPAGRVVDVDYRDLVGDPVGTMRRIHAHFGLPWDEAVAARAEAFTRANAQRRHGENPYTIAEYGQSEDELAARFRDYRDAFGLGRAAG